MTKNQKKTVERLVVPYIEDKADRYAEKFGWDEAYKSKAVRWMKRAVGKAVRDTEGRGEIILRPVKFAMYAATQSLKKDKTGKLIIPYWKKEIRTGSGVYATYAETKEEL